MSDDDARLDEVASELYRQPPAEFTALRTARAAEVGGSVGRRVARLRKPTVAAWAVNLLVHDGQLGEALELAAALREAQDDLDAGEMTRLGAQRRALVSALARRAADLAAEAGTALSPAASEAVRQTINAAVVDPSAAAAVMTGRIAAAIDPSSPSDDGLTGIVAGSAPSGLPPAPARDDLAARRARKAAERAVREAERARADAERARSSAEDRVVAARERADRLHDRRDELRRELARVEAEVDAADAELDRREDERTAADTTAHEAARALAGAQAALDESTTGE